MAGVTDVAMKEEYEGGDESHAENVEPSVHGPACGAGDQMTVSARLASDKFPA